MERERRSRARTSESRLMGQHALEESEILSRGQ